MTEQRKREASAPPAEAQTPEGYGSDAGAIAGELAGAVVGAAAGPVGAVAGMVVGAVAGALAGSVLEGEQRRASAHDAALDEAIGVIGGDLGIRRQAATAMDERKAERRLGASGLEPPRLEPRHSSSGDNRAPGIQPPARDPVRPLAADLLELIELRQSSRGSFDPHRRVPIEQLRHILTAARWAPTPHNMQNFEIVVVDDRNVLEALSNVEIETSRRTVR